MRRLVLAAGLACVTVPAAAQPNPFKMPKMNIKGGAEVTYDLTGDIKGSGKMAYDADRWMRQQTATMKMLGKENTTSSWSLTTPTELYNADLTKKSGTILPNMVPLMAKAYDDLDGDGKKRLHQNMNDMSSMMTKMFGMSSFSFQGESLGKKTYAGQECEERKVGPIVMCTMAKAPIMLHSQTKLLCFNMEETATAVTIGAVSEASFAKPDGITFTPDPRVKDADSVAKSMVMYLSSQQLADSLAKAKQELAAAQAKSGTPPGEMPKMTPEQEAEMQKACETMKNLDIGKVIADAANNVLKNMAAQMKQAAIDQAKQEAANKVKGLFKPKIP